MPQPLDQLSVAEVRVAVLSARGRSTDEMAETLFVSRNTIKTHVARTLSKVSARNRTELVGLLMFDDRFRDLVADPGVPETMLD